MSAATLRTAAKWRGFMFVLGVTSTGTKLLDAQKRKNNVLPNMSLQDD
jgi:hypothetical protein